MGQPARVIDLEEFRKKKEERPAPVAQVPVIWVWWVWAPVWGR